MSAMFTSGLKQVLIHMIENDACVVLDPRLLLIHTIHLESSKGGNIKRIEDN